jgi:hypothetical protein
VPGRPGTVRIVATRHNSNYELAAGLFGAGAAGGVVAFSLLAVGRDLDDKCGQGCGLFPPSTTYNVAAAATGAVSLALLIGGVVAVLVGSAHSPAQEVPRSERELRTLGQ